MLYTVNGSDTGYTRSLTLWHPLTLETRLKLPSLHLICAAIALLNAGDGIVATVFPPFLDAQGYTVSDIGFVVSVFAILSLISRMPSGLAYRPQRARQMMLVSAGIYAVTLPLYSLTRSAMPLFAVRSISGFAFGAATTLNMALLMDILPQGSTRSRVMAFYAASMTGGYAIGNSIGGWMGDAFGYDWTFCVASIAPLMAAFLTPRLAVAANSARTSTPPTTTSKHSLRAKLKQASSSQIVPIAQLAFTLNALLYVVTTFFPLYGF
jgi:MFS family permease